MRTKNRVVSTLQAAYRLLIQGGSALQPLILLTFRAHWGWALFITGKAKLFNHASVVEYFQSLGIPLPVFNAWFVGGLECVGGLLLALGLLSRPVALLMSGNMLVAYLSVEEDRAALLSVLTDAQSFLNAEPFFFLLVSVMVLAFGPGMISCDWLLKKIFDRKITAGVACDEQCGCVSLGQ